MEEVSTAAFDYALNAYDYELPPELIAQHPAAKRDASRLMVLEPNGGAPEHLIFHNIPRLFRPGDVLALNNTKVFPARLLGQKESGGKIELFLLAFPEISPGAGQNGWRCASARALLKSSKRARPGTTLFFGDKLRAEVLELDEDASARVRLFYKAECSLEEALNACGRIPLPPYILRPDQENAAEDACRYQTCFAKHTGSVAAPTAGLHFTPELLGELRALGVHIAPLTLHVGYGTFAPVRNEDIRAHVIHQEWASISAETANLINTSKTEGRRIWAAGTTTTRTLEFAALPQGRVRPLTGACGLYIYPGFRFQVVDNLVTNFHLPKSSLLFLVSALAGRKRILSAYEEAVRLRYRFFSYGDAMAIITKE